MSGCIIIVYLDVIFVTASGRVYLVLLAICICEVLVEQALMKKHGNITLVNRMYFYDFVLL